MTVIFKNLKVKTFTSKLNKFVKTNRNFKYVTCLVLAVASVVLTVAASGVTFGYTVSYSDRVIAVVSSEADYDKADAIVLNSIESDHAKDSSVSPEFGLTVTVKDRLNTTDEVVDAIINNNDKIIEAEALIVNGETLFCVEGNVVSGLLKDRLKAYDIENSECTSQFVDEIETEEGYFLEEDAVELREAEDFINTLSVKTVLVETYRVEIPFETKNVKDDTKVRGYSKVTTKGENGITEKTEETVMINGEVTKTNLLSSKVVKEQVTEVVTVGTANNYVSASTSAKAKAAGFICPLNAGRYTVSAYYGDGRNHKAIDLAADRGTPIFAAAAGTVTYAGWDDDYGYNVIITHSNGLKTRYAHANALCVSKGATVAQGDMIATVGSTGWSTGNHLHFEVIVNGARVNPGPYIGLR